MVATSDNQVYNIPDNQRSFAPVFKKIKHHESYRYLHQSTYWFQQRHAR